MQPPHPQLQRVDKFLQAAAISGRPGKWEECVHESCCVRCAAGGTIYTYIHTYIPAGSRRRTYRATKHIHITVAINQTYCPCSYLSSAAIQELSGAVIRSTYPTHLSSAAMQQLPSSYLASEAIQELSSAAIQELSNAAIQRSSSYPAAIYPAQLSRSYPTQLSSAAAIEQLSSTAITANALLLYGTSIAHLQ